MADAFVDPTGGQIADLVAAEDGPLVMLNLLRFRDRAAYPPEFADADKDVSGAKAYARYATATAPLLAAAGGAVIWSGRDSLTVIGPDDPPWQAALLVRYPSLAAFMGMIRSDAYIAIVVHRQAAIATSRLIRWPSEAGPATG